MMGKRGIGVRPRLNKCIPLRTFDHSAPRDDLHVIPSTNITEDKILELAFDGAMWSAFGRGIGVCHPKLDAGVKAIEATALPQCIIDLCLEYHAGALQSM